MHNAASVVPNERVALAPSMLPLMRSVGHHFKQYLSSCSLRAAGTSRFVMSSAGSHKFRVDASRCAD